MPMTKVWLLFAIVVTAIARWALGERQEETAVKAAMLTEVPIQKHLSIKASQLMEETATVGVFTEVLILKSALVIVGKVLGANPHIAMLLIKAAHLQNIVDFVQAVQAGLEALTQMKEYIDRLADLKALLDCKTAHCKKRAAKLFFRNVGEMLAGAANSEIQQESGIDKLVENTDVLKEVKTALTSGVVKPEKKWEGSMCYGRFVTDGEATEMSDQFVANSNLFGANPKESESVKLGITKDVVEASKNRLGYYEKLWRICESIGSFAYNYDELDVLFDQPTLAELEDCAKKANHGEKVEKSFQDFFGSDEQNIKVPAKCIDLNEPLVDLKDLLA